MIADIFSFEPDNVARYISLFGPSAEGRMNLVIQWDEISAMLSRNRIDINPIEFKVVANEAIATHIKNIRLNKKNISKKRLVCYIVAMIICTTAQIMLKKLASKAPGNDNGMTDTEESSRIEEKAAKVFATNAVQPNINDKLVILDSIERVS